MIIHLTGGPPAFYTPHVRRHASATSNKPEPARARACRWPLVRCRCWPAGLTSRRLLATPVVLVVERDSTARSGSGRRTGRGTSRAGRRARAAIRAATAAAAITRSWQQRSTPSRRPRSPSHPRRSRARASAAPRRERCAAPHARAWPPRGTARASTGPTASRLVFTCCRHVAAARRSASARSARRACVGAACCSPPAATRSRAGRAASSPCRRHHDSCERGIDTS